MLNPQLKPFLEVWDKAWTVLQPGAPVQDRRVLFEYIAERMRLPIPAGIQCTTQFVPSGGRNVLVRIERAANGPAKQPALVYMHGGGFMQGSPMTHQDITSRIAATNQQTVISVDYALAPEHPFPKAVNETMDVMRWVQANAENLGVDPARVSIGGDSAGANLAAGASIGLRGTPSAAIAQLLIYPPVDFEMTRPAYTENADAPLLKTASMPMVNKMYLPNEADRRNPLAAPYHAASHAGLPPAFIAVAQYDPLRDDGYAYAEKLRAAGVAVEFDAGAGLIHGYMRSMEYCEAAREKLAAMARWLAARNAGHA